MIFDNIQNISLYSAHGIKDRYKKAAEFMTTKDLAALAPGRYEIEGNNVYANVSEYTTVPWEEAAYEAHEKYTDIQCVVAGAEILTFAQTKDLKPGDTYDPAKDVIHYAGAAPGARFEAHAGEYLIFKPGEVHKSKGLVGAAAPVKKVLVKIREVE